MSEAIRNSKERADAFLSLLDAMMANGVTTALAEAVEKANALIADARPEDLVGAVDAAVARGDDFAALKPAVSKLVNLLATPLKRQRCAPPAGERLFSSLLAENAGLVAVLDRGKPLTKAVNERGLSAADLEDSLAALKAFVAELGEVEIHYRKKENVLFPWFEARYPEYRCVRLMWEIQDDARRGLREVARLLEEASAGFDPRPLNQALGRLYFDLHANVFREECALFPVMLPLVDPEDGERLFVESKDYGFAFLDKATMDHFEAAGATAAASPAAPGQARTRHASEAGLADIISPAAGGFAGRTGALPGEVLAAMFSALPVDMTYVDAGDKVRWFSDSPRRVFPRSPAIVGRDVRNCHPGASVGRVVAIIESFRRGDRDREAFWITMGGKFIYIEYFALRSPDGTYLGVLEASQDLTGLRALSGEKRLAD